MRSKALAFYHDRFHELFGQKDRAALDHSNARAYLTEEANIVGIVQWALERNSLASPAAAAQLVLKMMSFKFSYDSNWLGAKDEAFLARGLLAARLCAHVATEVEIHLLRGAVHEDRKQFADSLVDYAEAELAAKRGSLQEYRCRSLVMQARAYKQLNELDASARMLNIARFAYRRLGASDRFMGVSFELGELYLKLGRIPRARALFTRIVELGPPGELERKCRGHLIRIGLQQAEKYMEAGLWLLALSRVEELDQDVRSCAELELEFSALHLKARCLGELRRRKPYAVTMLGLKEVVARLERHARPADANDTVYRRAISELESKFAYAGAIRGPQSVRSYGAPGKQGTILASTH